ncbi:MAG: neutral/alkaline non-lysosomal ceramidase N-terminal domain-containing protein [Clostridiales bacterium]|nr:neutral/alkaline non-lysosomal ceramidase N-terminal domain-containing protein [Clostridiales bacterium]
MLKAGAAKTDITPPVGTELFGYRPGLVSTSVHDKLECAASVFSDGETTLVLISVTVCEIRNDIASLIREKCAEELKLSKENIILAATHTHCAPNVAGMEGWGDVNFEYLNSILLPGCVNAVKNAFVRLEDVSMSIGFCESLVGINRREIFRDGGIGLGQNPWGSIDKIMTAVKFKSVKSGEYLFQFIHYGCHGTACGAGTEITRDWQGVMQDIAEKETGAMTIFLNGAEGDVGPRLTNGQTVGDIGYVERLGAVAGSDALKALSNAVTASSPDISLLTGMIKIPYKPLPSLSEVEERLSKIENPQNLINCERLTYAGLCEIRDYLKAGKNDRDEEMTIEENIFRIGNVLFIPYPYEIFSEISLRLRKYLPEFIPLCLSCANGSNAYLPSEDQICRGGYEVDVFKAAGLKSLPDNADQILIEKTMEIIEGK